ncbi:MAG: hypothetical protein RSD40_04850, partial [Bacilli bacterium]
MNILWVTNISIYDFKQELNRSISNSGGWIQEFYKFFEKNKRNNIIVCSFDVNIKKTICSIKDNSSHYLIPKDIKNPCKYDCSVEKELEMIILKENPDIIHIWGTEFAHSLSALKVAKRLEIKNIISIQGLISNCANHYCDGIPRRVLRRYTFRDFIRMDNLLQQQKKFVQRGIFESNSLEIAKHVIGRTDYDYSYIKTKYKDIDYYFCNECLREEFYNYKWNVNNIDRHTIFISQASYPIKGFHYFLAGLKIIK